MTSPRKTVVIVGAGIAGLTLALLLARQGLRPVVIEREREVGGLARSFAYDGFTFDIGPHRFHSDNPLVDAFVREVLGEDLIEIERRSGVWIGGRYLDWPLDVSAAFKLPFSLLFASFLELFKKREQGDDSFESYIIARYGRPLYEEFFRGYTEKFLGLPCSMISRDWAVTGIDRAVIDSSIRMDDLKTLVFAACRPSAPLTFLYPGSGGIGVFSKRLARMVEQAGGTVFTGVDVVGIEIVGEKIHGVIVPGEGLIKCDNLYWSASITGLQDVLGYPPAGLSFLSMLLYNYRVREPARVPYQWCYFGSADIPFNRVSIPSRFNPGLSPPGKVGVCVEVTCHADDPRMECPEKAEPAIRRVLANTSIIGGQAEIEGVAIERIPEAYPIYSIDYQQKLDTLMQKYSQISNLHLLGRSGRFWYNNMDNSIEDAIIIAKVIGEKA